MDTDTIETEESCIRGSLRPVADSGSAAGVQASSRNPAGLVSEPSRMTLFSLLVSKRSRLEVMTMMEVKKKKRSD